MKKSISVLVLPAIAIAAFGLSACSSENKDAQVPETTQATTVAADSFSWGQHVDLSEFKNFLDTKAPVIVDVRTAEEFQSGHIPGAINIDVTAPDFAQQVGELDKDKSYAIYCRSGNRSRAAQAQMMQAGLGETLALEGGINVWDGELE